MPSFDTVIPFLSIGNMSKVTWNYLTVPQKNAAKGMKEEVGWLGKVSNGDHLRAYRDIF